MIDPVAITILGREIRWYGVMFALGFLAAVMHWNWLGKGEKRKEGTASELAIWIIVGSVIGARLAYVIANWSTEFAANPLSIFRIDQGGLIFYGGFFGGFATVLWLARRMKESPWSLGDFVLSGLPLGHAFGRMGCFLNGCCYGSPTQSIFGLPVSDLEGVKCHPVQLYEVGLLLTLYLMLLFFYRRRRFNGQIVGMYAIGYGVIRLTTEMFRGDPRQMASSLTVAQAISAGLIVFGLFVLTALPRWVPKLRREPSAIKSDANPKTGDA